jgi:hypothetical protein
VAAAAERTDPWCLRQHRIGQRFWNEGRGRERRTSDGQQGRQQEYEPNPASSIGCHRARFCAARGSRINKGFVEKYHVGELSRGRNRQSTGLTGESANSGGASGWANKARIDPWLDPSIPRNDRSGMLERRGAGVLGCREEFDEVGRLKCSS